MVLFMNTTRHAVKKSKMTRSKLAIVTLQDRLVGGSLPWASSLVLDFALRVASVVPLTSQSKRTWEKERK